MTDLRAALNEACDIAETLYTEFSELERVRLDRTMVDASAVPDHLATLRSIATSPLTVLDALRDPEVRAGRVWAQMERHEHEAKVTYHRRWTIRDGRLLMQWSTVYRGQPPSWTFTNAEGDHPTSRPSLADFDSPCRLVPAEGDHA